jgi:hypothetical protein
VFLLLACINRSDLCMVFAPEDSRCHERLVVA